MILSDRDLLARLEKGDLVIDPISDVDLQVQPASIDLRLDHRFIVYKLPHVSCIDMRAPSAFEQYTETIEVDPDEGFVLHPGEFALGSTVEWVKLPPDLVARVDGRSSIGRLAIVVHATAGFIDPGFEGHITLELANLGRCAVKLYPGMRISQLVVEQMSSPAARPYGSADRGSKYQGQRGPTASRISVDKK